VTDCGSGIADCGKTRRAGSPSSFRNPLSAIRNRKGVLAGELLGGKGLLPAGQSTWGTLLGTTAGMIIKVIIGLAMIGWFLAAALL